MQQGASSKVAGTARSKVTGTASSRAAGTARSKVVGTASSRAAGTARSKVVGTARSKVVGTARTKAAGTARSKAAGTAKSKVVGTARTFANLFFTFVNPGVLPSSCSLYLLYLQILYHYKWTRGTFSKKNTFIQASHAHICGKKEIEEEWTPSIAAQKLTACSYWKH